MGRGEGAGLIWLAAVVAACGSSPASPDASPHDAGPHDATPDGPVIPAELTLTSDYDEFGTTPVATTSLPIHLTARNSGGAPTGLLATSLDATPMQFSIGADTCNGAVLAAGAECTFEVRFVPQRTGTADVRVRVEDGTVRSEKVLGASASTNDDVNVASPSIHDFGDVAIGTGTPPRTFTVTNIGATTHAAISLVKVGSNAVDFTVVADGCTSTALPPGGSCTFGVTFTPSASGMATAQIQIVSNPGVAVVGVRGVGLDPTLRIDLPSRHFGSVPITGQSEYARFEVTNISTSATAPLATTIGGTHAGDFTIGAATNTCASTALAPGATCTVEVRFEPAVVQDRTARLVVTDGTSTATTDLRGAAGTSPGLEIHPTPFSFGDVTVGQASAPQTFTIVNRGANLVQTLNIFSSSAVFQISSDTCTGTMPVQNASCTFVVTARPVAAGFSAHEVGTFVYSGLLVRGIP